MGNKKTIALGLAVLAVILALLLMRPDPAPVPTVPAVQSQTRPRPTRSEQTEPMTAPAATEPMETEPAQTLPPQTTGPQEPEQTAPVQTLPPETEPSVPSTEAPQLFPVLLEDGMLTVQSIFSFTGMNPDAELQFGESIAGVQLTNTSDLHLTEAEIEVVLDNGTILTFRVEDVAPGMSVMAFSLEHGTLADPAHCAEVFGYAEFEAGDPLRSDLVEITVEGIAVTVTNVSGEDLTDLDVICHGLLDGSCFGGRTYTYRIDSLSAGGSTTILAQDCILGMTQVARVELGE